MLPRRGRRTDPVMGSIRSVQSAANAWYAEALEEL
jgi:hypothetical protein